MDIRKRRSREVWKKIMMDPRVISQYYKYIYPFLFIIPLNIFIIGNGIGQGVQWVFFRYQVTYFGSSFIPLTHDVGYLINGTLTGRTAISELLIITAAIGFIIAFILLLSNYSHAKKISGVITVANGLLLLASSVVQYGVLLHGASGESIPIGVPIIFVLGACMISDDASHEQKSKTLYLLNKYDYILLFIGITLIYYLHTPLLPFSNDTIPNQLIPYYILHDHTLYLDQATTYINNTNYVFRFVGTGGGHYVSLFPVVTPILTLPLYTIPITILNIPMTDFTLLLMGKICAALFSALACVFVYLTCKKIASHKIALISTLIFAFATSTWSISSQVLWAHCVVEFLLSFALYLIIRNEVKESVFNVVVLGIISGLFVFNRPSDAILIIPIIFYVLRFCRDKFKYYISFALISGSPFLIYNVLFFGNPLGGYLPIAYRLGLNLTTIMNYIGLIAAPNKGLLVFSPILVLAIVGFLVIWNRTETRMYMVLKYFVPVILLNLAIYALFDDWIGGSVYGPRYLTGILPVLAICVCLALNYLFETDVLHNRMRTIILVIVSFLVFGSVLVQVIGVFYYPVAVNSGLISSENYDPWTIENSIIVKSFVYGSNTNLSYLKPVVVNESLLNEKRTIIEPGKILL